MMSFVGCTLVVLDAEYVIMRPRSRDYSCSIRINFEIKVKVEAIKSGLIVVSKGTVGLLVLVKPFLYL